MQSTTTQSERFNQIPEPGQLVEIRRRQWVVTQIDCRSLTCKLERLQHLVTMESIDEDAMGEELQVIWQLEPGAKILERVGLPTISGFDLNYKLDAFLDAVRWGAASNADRQFLQAPFRSGITIEDYQLDPLVRAVDMARVNLLIADDVGLGKTIEAGLVIQELLIRHRARTVFVVSPASLQSKWQTEMQEKFGLEFRIVDTAYIKMLRRERGLHANPWTSYPRLITSMDWIKSGEGLRLLKDVLPPQITYPRKFDILVIDEAHNVAPAAAAAYSLPSQRTQVIQRLAPHFAHHLFLTATPHNGYQESFTSLLELLDDQRFAKMVMPNEQQLQQVMVRRLKSNIVDTNGNPVFPKRELRCLEVDYSDEEKEIHNLLRQFTESRMQTVGDSRYAYGTKFVHILLKKRLFSSPAAFAKTLAKHRETLANGRKKTKGQLFDDRILHRAIMKAEEEFSNEAAAEEAMEEVLHLDAELTIPLTAEQQTLLNKLSEWAERAKNISDSKAKAILSWLKKHLKPDGKWNNKRVILFTEYRDTHSWLQTLLTHNGFGGEHLMVMHGELPPIDRETVKAAFQTSPQNSPVKILLATDAASEGIDLQNYCNYLIHVEIPWNPNVMEQRNGRIDRHGQKEPEVYIWHPVGKGFAFGDKFTNKPGDIVGDFEYLMRATLKIDAIREDLGSVGSVIARQIEDAMLGQNSVLDTSAAEKKRKRARKLVAAEKRLQERISRLHERLLEAQNDFHLTPSNIANAVKVALEMAGKPALKPVMLPGLPEKTAWELPMLSGSWSQALNGLNHPHTGQKRAITFDHAAAKGREDLVLAHLNHRLVQMSLRLLREEIWKLDDVKHLQRVAIRNVPSLETPNVIIWSRLVITGGDHHRLHEELTLSGGELKHGTFRRITTQRELDRMLSEAMPQDSVPDRAFAILKERFSQNEESIMAAVEARSRERLRDLEHTIQLRKESEITDIIRILDELDANIRKELKEPSIVQLTFEFFTEDEKLQLKKDINALRNRLSRIPEEKEQEKATIEKHYANPQARTFPVAVIFLVPQTKAWGKK
jgi:superfamily II DNA or RNA helicase